VENKINTYGIVFGLAVAALLCGNVARVSAQADPKVTPLQAMKAATAKVPGRALNATFEKEDGKWMYTVWVVSGKTLTEVQVDAVSGTVGEAEVFTPEKEAKDVKEELKEELAAEAAPPKAKAPAAKPKK
jgi:uncharacterized iron-regulated membrane protein